MKVLLLICILSIFLFMFTLREGMTNAVDPPEVTELKALVVEYHPKITLAEMRYEISGKIKSRQDRIEDYQNHAFKSSEHKKRVYETIIPRIQSNIVKFQSTFDTLTKLIDAKGKVKDTMTLEEAISALKAETKEVKKEIKEVRNEIIESRDELDKKYAGINNPFINPFIYVKNRYNYSDKTTIKNISKDLISRKLTQENTVMMGKLKELGNKYNENTSLGDILNIYMGPDKPPTLNKNENIFVTLKNTPLSKLKSKNLWTSNNELGNIAYKLDMYMVATNDYQNYIEKEKNKSNPYVKRADDIKSVRNYVKNLMDRMIFQLISGKVKETDKLENVLKVPEKKP
jgi:hypothetical protein